MKKLSAEKVFYYLLKDLLFINASNKYFLVLFSSTLLKIYNSLQNYL